MSRWLNSASVSFLSDRLLLYEVTELCATFPGAGTPSHYLGLTRKFSDYVCVEIDKGLAQYRRWYLARFEERKKQGKNKWVPRYATLGEALGIGADDRAGMTAEEFTVATKAYKDAAVQAALRGEELPDVETWMEAYEASLNAEDDDLD